MPTFEKELTVSPQESLLLHIIPVSKENAVKRETLSKSLEITDRTLRRMIHDLRTKGFLIISNTKTGGYYLATEQEDIASFVAQQKHRIGAIQKSITAISKQNLTQEKLV